MKWKHEKIDPPHDAAKFSHKGGDKYYFWDYSSQEGEEPSEYEKFIASGAIAPTIKIRRNESKRSVKKKVLRAIEIYQKSTNHSH